MSRGAGALALALSLAVSAACRAAPPAASPAHAAVAPTSRTAHVDRIVDGDTFVLAGGERVRLLGVDTPEVHDASPVLRDLAGRARAELGRLAEGRDVALDVATPPKDKFGRTLAYAEIGGQDVGAALLEAGLARLYPTEHARLERYLALESAARAKGVGVWTHEAHDAWGPRASVTIAPGEAAAHLGETVRVEGTLARTHRTQKALFLDVERDGAKLAVVTFHLWLFPEALVKSWEGQPIAVTGLLKEYKGAPEIVVDRPDQIEIPGRDTPPPH